MTDRDGLRDIRVPLRYAPTLELPPARPANVFDVLAEGYAAACTGLVAGAQAMSLDAQRRAFLLERIDGATQTLMTTTELDIFTPEFLQRATIWEVEAGQIETVAQTGD